MKCCYCGKDIDVSFDVIPPQWFGWYSGANHLEEVTCLECLKENREDWRTRGSKKIKEK